MSRNQARFSQLPRAAVIDTRLTPTDFKVLAIIGLYLNHDHEAWPSQNTIAEVGDMSRRTVIRAIQNLEQFGYVESRKKFPNRPGTHKCYRVVMDVTPESAKSVTSENANSVTSGCDIAMSLPIRTSPVEHTDTNVSVLPTISEQAVQRGSGRVRGSARGSRIAPDWTPSLKDYAFAHQAGLSREEINREADRFRDYWIAASGRNAVKLDWSATWRNWIRSDYRKPKASQHRGGAEQTLSAFDRVAARLAGDAGRTAAEARSDADTIDGEYWPVEEGTGPG